MTPPLLITSASTRPAPRICDVIAKHVERDPTRAAMRFDDAAASPVVLTRASLDDRVARLAYRLADRCAPGERAVIACPIGPEFLIAFLACLRAGVVAVPIYPPSRRPSDLQRALRIVADARARVLLTTAAALPLAQLFVASMPSGMTPLELVSTETEGYEPAHTVMLEERRRKVELAFLQYTSGSTDHPKGVMVSHANLLHNLAAMQHRFQYTQDTQGVHWVPPYHDMGLIGCCLLPLYVGFCGRALSPLDFMQRPVRWLRALSECGESTSPAPTFGYARCVERITPEEMAGLDLSRWRIAIVGAEPVRPDVLDAFARKFAPVGFRREAFYPCYGLAESTLMVSGGKVMAGPRVFRLDARALELGRAEIASSEPEVQTLDVVGCGVPTPGDDVVITDPETASECEGRRIGEIWVRSASVCTGYWTASETTMEQPFARLPGEDRPFLRTGDLGAFVNGELIVTGRRRDLLIVAGKNHHPQDVELTIESNCDAVATGRGAVFQLDDGEIGAVFELRQSSLARFDAQRALSAVRRAVTAKHGISLAQMCFAQPGAVPRTSSGKIRRRECKHMLARGELMLVSLTST